VILILGIAACGESDSGEPASTAAATVAATATTEATPALGAGRQALDAGPHILDLVARDERGTGPAHLPKIQITVPEGWFNFDGWAMSKGPEVDTVFVMFWDVDKVDPHPCEKVGKPMVDPGPDVDGLAAALAKQPLRNATTAREIVLDRFKGKYLELSVPSDIDFEDCDDGQFDSWTANGWAGGRYQQAPGQVDRIWILDVHGARLVIDASYLPNASPHDRAELDAVVKSIQFLD
jgi:hypothetical protein